MLYSRNDEFEIIWKSFGHSHGTIIARVPVTQLCRFIEHRVSTRSHIIYLYITLLSHLDSVTCPKAVCPLYSVFGEGGNLRCCVLRRLRWFLFWFTTVRYASDLRLYCPADGKKSFSNAPSAQNPKLNF